MVEFLLSKIDNLDFNLQLIIEKEKHDVHDRLILTDFYLVHFGDSFNFFFNNNEVDELDRRAKLSFVTFESFLKSNYYYKNLSIREWFKEKIQNNPDNYILRGKGIDYLLNS